MVHATRRFAVDRADVAVGLDRIRAELDVPARFPAEVEAAAAAATPVPAERTDRRDLPFVTIDPPGSTDLDQALAIEPTDGGHVVWYAIADVAAFVTPGDLVDVESRARGVTLYAPDARAPLHPAPLSEGSASLLAGVDRPAVLWRMVLDGDGALVDTDVGRAVVRSREQLTYAEAQARIDAGDDLLGPLATVGRLRTEHELARGGVSLPLPEQEVHTDADGTAVLAYRSGPPVEQWNAQLSLLCGMAAASIMLGADAGLLRTLPPAPAPALAALRREADALGVPWPSGATYGEVVRAADPTDPRHAAFLHQCTRLFRGADYRPLGVEADSDRDRPLVHAAIAAPYAHVTAPLRRLGDRFATEAVLAVVRGRPVPEWVEAAIAEMPEVLRSAKQKASALDRAVLDLVEALVLEPHVGESFPATVVDHRGERAIVQIAEPAIVARIDALPPLGTEITVRLDAVDVADRRIELWPA